MPTARDFAAGQVWFRKGLTVIIPWRPPYGLSDSNGIPYEPNELRLRIAKSKPKGTSKVGVYTLFLDTERYQYYMKDGFTDNRIYADREYHNIRPWLQKESSNNTMTPVNTINGFKQSNFDKQGELDMKEETGF
jgi:hypothetical protein